MKNESKGKSILITGAAGFIGAALIKRLLSEGKYESILGIDNINDYYDVKLKYDRLKDLGFKITDIDRAEGCCWNKIFMSDLYPSLRFQRTNLHDVDGIAQVFDDTHFDIVVHLGAQAGVRYSIDNPRAYIESNINGFINILEGCRHKGIKHLVYASSSSVYGLNGKVPFSESDGIAHPVSLYAATKKSNELMAHTYSHLYNIPTTGLRFFTVYGPWGRPDMSPFLFIDNILRNKEIKVFNNGNMLRDFTYIDDITMAVSRIMAVIPEKATQWDNKHADPAISSAPYRVYNIGNSTPVNLIDYISEIESALGKKAKKILLPMQPGDVYMTYADTSALEKAIGFKPKTSLKEGIKSTVQWFKDYYSL